MFFLYFTILTGVACFPLGADAPVDENQQEISKKRTILPSIGSNQRYIKKNFFDPDISSVKFGIPELRRQTIFFAPNLINIAFFLRNLKEYMETCWIKKDPTFRVDITTLKEKYEISLVRIAKEETQTILTVVLKSTDELKYRLAVSGELVDKKFESHILAGIHRSALSIKACEN